MYMLFQRRSFDFPIPDKPQPRLRVPSAFRRLRGFHQLLFRKSNPHRDKRVVGITLRRGPFSLFYNQLDRLQPLLRLRIIFETNAKQGIAILFHESFGAGLPRFENQPRFHLTLRMSLSRVSESVSGISS